jgi:histidine ammonia-lyase
MRKALALMNGTSAMTGIGIINLNFAKKLIDASLMMTGLLTGIGAVI